MESSQTYPTQTVQDIALRHPLHLVDAPGHLRLRSRSLAHFLPDADGVVFSVDSAHGLSGQGIRSTGEHLHILLSLLRHLETSSTRSRGRRRAPPPLLILFSRADAATATTSTSRTKSQLLIERGKTALQREMERRQQASQAATATASARLEALEEIPDSSRSFVSSIFSFGRRTGTAETDSAGCLPSDEAEILAADALAMDGPWDWNKLGFDITWDTASSRDGEKAAESNGVKGFWAWVDSLP
jgi:signal recognition particle receptor subunit beta